MATTGGKRMTTNFEKIKSLTFDEMAEHHYKFANSFIIAILKVIKEKTGVEFEELPSYENVISDIKQWLKQESEG